MKQAIIGKNKAYAAKIGGGTISGINEMHLLDDGAIAIFTDENELLTSGNCATTLEDKKAIFIAVGSGVAANGSLLTSPIPRFGTTYYKKNYLAPVKTKKFVGEDSSGNGDLNLPTLVAGDEIYIKISDTTQGFINTIIDFHSYTDTVRAGDTASSIVTRLVAQINADSNRIVDATQIGSGAGIQLDAIDYGTTFEISLDGILRSATIEEAEAISPNIVGAAVAPTYGEGTSDQVAAIEEKWSSYRGNTAKREFTSQFYSNPSKVIDGERYDIYNLTWKGVRGAAVNAGPQPTLIFEDIVALVVASSQQSTFETIMAEAFGNPATIEMGS